MEKTKQRAKDKSRIGGSSVVQDFDVDFEVEEEEEVVVVEKSTRKNIKLSYSGSRKMGGGGGGGGPSRCCQADDCTADLTEAKQYHRRHKVCERHAKAQVVVVAGMRQRFCQQCSRFHELSEFDETKRSCRRRLAGHNERRRKASGAEVLPEGSNRGGGGGGGGGGGHVKEPFYGLGDDRGRIIMAMHENTNYKHLQIT